MRPHDPRDGCSRRWHTNRARVSPRTGRDGRATRRRPVLEGLETRVHLAAVTTASTAQSDLPAAPCSRGGPIGLQPGPRGFLDRTHRQAAHPVHSSTQPSSPRPPAELYSASSPPGIPTPREIRRQIFTARWIGQYTIGPPRFSDRASTIHLYGVDGGSNQFLIGKFQIALFPPADPSAMPTPGNPYANQITGVAGLFPQNYLQSGALLVLDLNATAGTWIQQQRAAGPSDLDL